MDKLLIFGGAGYIGSHTCKVAAQNGYDPVVFDNFCTGHREFVRWGNFIEGDIRDREAVAGAFNSAKPAAVINFAGLIDVAQSMKDPGVYYDNNVLGCHNILEAVRGSDIPFVFSSTAAVYGRPAKCPVGETDVSNPINTYGASKLMAEQIIRDFGRAHGVKSICLRYFNASGADAEGELGEAHKPETHLVPRAVLSGLGMLENFSVYGRDFPTPDGTPVRDYIHVNDLARAHLLAVKYLRDGGKSEVLNVGSGQGVSVLELVDTVGKACGRDIAYSWDERRSGDPPELVADIKKIREILGFVPEQSNLPAIVSSAVKWHASAKYRSIMGNHL